MKTLSYKGYYPENVCNIVLVPDMYNEVSFILFSDDVRRCSWEVHAIFIGMPRTAGGRVRRTQYSLIHPCVIQ